MIRHAPTCLDGPLTKDRSWWVAPEPRGVVVAPDSNATENEFRPDLVRRVRAEIAAGTYDTPEKWDLALSRLLGGQSQE
jgi:hypothetical protein